MTLFITLVTILMSLSISLGVGASTLAILNFFTAIADGSIDDTERRMMGIVYIVLRVAMTLILACSFFLLAGEYSTYGITDLSTGSYFLIFLLGILYVNALLMTAHLVPSTIGPAIQAGTWYTLGILSAIPPITFSSVSFGQLILSYTAWLILVIGIVNGIMAWMKVKRPSNSH